jgi:acyl CoA:acetate/3-ketoacid CoA transferase alpha subunit
MARIVDELRSLEPHGISEKVIQKLIDSGVAGLSHVLEMTAEDLTTIEDIGPKTAEKIREAAAVAQAEWEKKDAEFEAERLEAERVEAERLEAERLAEEQAAAAAAAEADEAAPEAGDGEVAAPVDESSADGGETDGQR